MPRSLHRAVRARRASWRLRNAPGGLFAALAPAAWAIVLTFTLVTQAAVTAAFPVAVGTTMGFVRPLPVQIVLCVVWFALWATIGVSATTNLGAVVGAVIRFAVAYHRIDLRPAVPTRIVATGWIRRSVVHVTDLTEVIVREHDQKLEVVLRTRDRTIVCEATSLSPLSEVDPPTLAAWLDDILEPSRVRVRHYHGTLDSSLVRQNWLPTHMVARIWQVPMADVPTLATRYEVRTTRAGDTSLFDAYDIDEHTRRATA
jgi:hypothetical protein